MTTAFVLSGGGSLGAVQVGMLFALAEQHVTPDLLVGTSVGALNAAFIAAHGVDTNGIEALADVWAGLHAHSVFTIEPQQVIAAVAGRRDSICTNAGLRKLLDAHLSFSDLEDAPIPLVIVATDLLSGTEVPLAKGPAAPAILASSAIPGVFPTIEIDGLRLTDGGLADNTAVSQAVQAGADTIYVLPTGHPCALSDVPGSALGVATQALTLMVHQRLVSDIARYSTQVDLIVLRPPCPLRIAPTDFGHARDLIRTSYEDAAVWLATHGGRRSHPERHVATHSHRQRASSA